MVSPELVGEAYGDPSSGRPTAIAVGEPPLNG
jgi:hypothetical protein